jgi:Trk K+ transport system NAD-binding subunit
MRGDFPPRDRINHPRRHACKLADVNGHVIVCGLGNVGRQIALRLRDAGAEVVGVDLAPSPRALHLAEQAGVRIVVGDARLAAVLHEAGLATARSIVIATANDPINLEIALIADGDDADVRIILRMFNPAIAQQLEAQFPRWTVLSLPDLAAPTLIAAALSPNVLRGWRIEGRLMALAEVDDQEPTSLSEYPEVTPVYLRRGDAVEFWPARDARVEAHERVGVIAPVERLQHMAGILRHAQPAPSPWFGRLISLPLRVWHGVQTMVLQTEPILLWILGLIFGVGLFSIGVFALFFDLSVLDSLYFVTTIMTTTGFGDITLREAPPALKLYGVFLMVLGAGFLMPSVYAFVTLYIVSARLQHLLGTIRADFSDHIVVVGMGTVGFRVLEGLKELRPRVIGLDRGDGNELARTAADLGTTVVQGDARRIETLRLANVHRARTIVVATSDDVVNLETALNARRQNPRLHVVLRLFDQSLAERVGGALGLGASFSPSGLAAPVFASAALGRSAIEAFSLHGRDLVLGRLEIEPPWDGHTVAELAGQAGLHAIALVRMRPADAPEPGRVMMPPGPDEPLRTGDALVAIGEAGAWEVDARAFDKIAAG